VQRKVAHVIDRGGFGKKRKGKDEVVNKMAGPVAQAFGKGKIAKGWFEKNGFLLGLVGGKKGEEATGSGKYFLARAN